MAVSKSEPVECAGMSSLVDGQKLSFDVVKDNRKRQERGREPSGCMMRLRFRVFDHGCTGTDHRAMRNVGAKPPRIS